VGEVVSLLARTNQLGCHLEEHRAVLTRRQHPPCRLQEPFIELAQARAQPFGDICRRHILVGTVQALKDELARVADGSEVVGATPSDSEIAVEIGIRR